MRTLDCRLARGLAQGPPCHPSYSTLDRSHGDTQGSSRAVVGPGPPPPRVNPGLPLSSITRRRWAGVPSKVRRSVPLSSATKGRSIPTQATRAHFGLRRRRGRAHARERRARAQSPSSRGLPVRRRARAIARRTGIRRRRSARGCTCTPRRALPRATSRPPDRSAFRRPCTRRSPTNPTTRAAMELSENLAPSTSAPSRRSTLPP